MIGRFKTTTAITLHTNLGKISLSKGRSVNVVKFNDDETKILVNFGGRETPWVDVLTFAYLEAAQ